MRLLPFEYAVRNLGRSPLRLFASIVGGVLVVLLVVAAGAFVRGMEKSLTVSGNEKNVILLGAGSEESLERSQIGMNVPTLVAASVDGIKRRLGTDYVSPEVHMALVVKAERDDTVDYQAVVRGVTENAFLVHPQVQIVEGRPPRMLEGEREKLLKMEDRLHDRVVGQAEAVRAVSDAVRRSRAGLGDPNRPIGSFLFLGPTGVGKTELCKALAEFLFDDESAFVRIDMSEFMEQHSVARLIGAPPGYVGFEEGGRLTEAVHRRSYSVILFDEIEKAHPDVFNTLLQVLDDGRLTDGHGRTVDFKNTIIAMTSNIGSDHIQRISEQASSRAAYDEATGRGGTATSEDIATDIEIEMAVKEELKKHFRPEFLNRIDETIIFHRLSKEDLRHIVDIQLRYLEARLAEREITLTLTDEARDKLAADGYDPTYGARPLKRMIQQQIENPLAKRLLSGEFAAGAVIRVDVSGDTFAFVN